MRALVLSALALAFFARGLKARADEVGQSFILLNMGAATAPGSGNGLADYGLGLGQRRPGGNGGNLEQDIGGRIGLGDRSSVAAHGIFSGGSSGIVGEVATQLYRPSNSEDFSSTAAAQLYSLGGVQQGRLRLSLDKRFGNWATAIQTLLSHQFQSGSDGVDYLVAAGVNYALSPIVSAGLEYIGQDLEALVSNDAEGGARHTVGPAVYLRPLQSSIRLLVGPAYEHGPQGAGWLGRAAISFEL